MAHKNIRSLSYRKEFEPNLFEQISEKSLQHAPNETFTEIANNFLINPSTVYGTASFYDFTKLENRSHKIHICNGSACLTAGSQEIVKQKLNKYFSDEEIGHATCLGHCHSNSAFKFHDNTFSLTENMDLNQVLHSQITTNQNYFVASDSNPILTTDISNVVEFYQLALTYKEQTEKIINEIKISKLRGRGGAGFPFWFKLDAVKQEKNTHKYIVCNADEGDPGAYSDMYLLENQPHKVLFGMYISGMATGANTGILYIRGEYPNSIKTINKAIENIVKQNLTPNFKWKVIQGQGAYVCGEETALLNSIEGLRPEVRVRPPYPAQYGLFGKPTVLSNVETFANLHWILENGGEKFAKIGTSSSTGTKLVSLDSHFNRPGIYEIAMGTPFEEVIHQFGLGFNKPMKAVQVGGPLGGIVPIEKFTTLHLDFESFSQNSFLLGHAGVVGIPLNFPMIEYLKHLLKFASDESCGKCFPCRIGTYRGYELLEKATHSNYKIDKKLWDDLLETLEKGSLCALGSGVPLPIRNALQFFGTELNDYFI